MKKFLTFFAMMLALLTGVLPAQAYDFLGTVTVDIANTGWTSAPYFNIGHGSYRRSYQMTKVDGYETRYQWNNSGGTWVGYTRWSVTQDPISTSGENVGLGSSAYYSEAAITTDRLIVLMPNSGMQTNVPFIYIDGASNLFSIEGSNWVYTVDASDSDKTFRLQRYDSTSSLEDTGTLSNTVLYGDDRTPISADGVRSLFVYGGNGGNYTATAGAKYKLSFPTTTTFESGKELSLTITRIEIRPSTPSLPAGPTVTGNVVKIPDVADADIYYTYTESGNPQGDPSTNYDWHKYDPSVGIELTKGYTTIRAAAYASGQWSYVTSAVTYTYTLPVATVSINIHTGIATLSCEGMSSLPDGATPVILYSCDDKAPYKVYTSPVSLAEELGSDASSYYIKAIVRAWGGGNDHSEAVSGQSVDSDIRNASWVGPAAVRRICLWSYSTSGTPVRLGEFSRQSDGSYAISRSSVSGTDSGDLTQRYFIRVVMNHDDPDNDNSDTGGTYYALGDVVGGATTVANGTEHTGFSIFTPSKDDARGMYFDGTDRDAVKLTLNGGLQEYEVSEGVQCSRFVPSAITAEWNPDAYIKSVTLQDASGNILCNLIQNLDTEEENIWTGVTPGSLPPAVSGNPANTKLRFVAETKDGIKYYSIGTNNANYWIDYGFYDQTSAANVYSYSSGEYYFCVKTAGQAMVGIEFDGTDATKISVSPYSSEAGMDISGTPYTPSITGEGSEVGSWETSRYFIKSEALNGWVYTFTATANTAQMLIYGSKGNLYAPVGLFLGSPTTVWRQVPSSVSATDKQRFAAKVPGLQVGARYRILLTDAGSGDVRVSIEALPESVRKIKKVELVNRSQSDRTEGEFTYDAADNVWNFYPLVWDGNPSGEISKASDLYYIRVTAGYDNAGSEPDVVRYVSWSGSSADYQLNSVSQYTGTPVTYTSLADNYNFKICNNGSYYVQVTFDDATLSAVWMGVSTTKLTPTYTPAISGVAWSLSDDAILAPGDTKYFYMSAIQNDNRLSPEWELLKQDDGKYVLDNFVVIPAAQFIIRGVTKSASGELSITDWGYADDIPYHIYATGQDFNLDTAEGLAEGSKVSAAFTMQPDKGRGFFWNIGATMVRLEFDPEAVGTNLTATIDFSYPSTLKQAPLHGFPWIGLTSSNIQALRGSNQTYHFASDLSTTGITDDDLKNIGISSAEDLNHSFTNAFIQWTHDGKPYIYDSHVSATDVNGRRIYYFDGNAASDNRVTTGELLADNVMSSTILPPRNAPQFQMISSKGIDTPDAGSLTFKYVGEVEKTFERNGSTTKPTRFAVYEIENIELQGMFKVFTGYGARTYGTVANGLSWFPNWGVGIQKDTEPYANMLINSTSQLPMNGGGQVVKDDNGKEVSTKSWTAINYGDSEDYGDDDNIAGQYFRLDNSQYVSSLKFYLALESDTDDRNSTLFHNPHASEANYYNDGRNYSWLDVQFEAERPVITLNKRGTNSATVRYFINPAKVEARPQIKSYKTRLVKVDPDAFAYDETTGEITAGQIEIEGGNTYTLEEPYLRYLEEETVSISNLSEGTYVAFIYDVEYVDETGLDLKDTDHWNISQRITIFSVDQGQIRGEQRVTSRDGVNVYHPVVRVYPDIQSVISELPSDVTLDAVSAAVTVGNIRPDSKFQDVEGAAIPEKSTISDPDSYADIYYEITQEYKAPSDNGGTEQTGIAVVHYPKGYFTDSRTDMEDFIVVNCRINNLTSLTLDVTVEGAPKPAPVTAEVFAYMPAGRLYGTLVADRHEDGSVRFNSLRVTNGDEVEESGRDGYARIRFAERTGDGICYAGSLDGTAVHAQVYYIGEDETGSATEVKLFDDAALLDMKAESEGEGVYAAARLKIGGIPYRTDAGADDALAIDIDGTPLKLRQDQEVRFIVELTYENEGITMPAVTSRRIETELAYGDNNLTSPRQGLRDVLTEADADARNTDDTVAKDVTAVSESFIESYGGLFVNIEDAHVALAAVGINDELVSEKSLSQWYMDHGDKWPGTEDVNPFNPGYHLAVGNAKKDGSGTYSAPAEVHPLLRGSNAVTSADGFRNDSEVNNAWWNTRASVAPEFHVSDHINGSLTIEGGKVTGFTAGSTHPKDHAAYWAGVKAANADAYKVWDGGYVLKVGGADVDIRDPRHGYYDNGSHYSTSRSAYRLGEMPLDANDIIAAVGKGNNGSIEHDERTEFYTDPEAVLENAKKLHAYSESINSAVNSGQSSVTIEGESYDVSVDTATLWDKDKVWKAREDVAFTPMASLSGKSPAELLFDSADNHMFFKVRHVNHESWFVPGGGVQYDLKTRPLWPAFVSDPDFQSAANDAAKDVVVMNKIRINPENYCPLAYDVRYVYPFLTSDNYVTAEAASSSALSRAGSRSIAAALESVTAADVDDIVARDKGRVSFFGAVTPENVVPTVISDVADDIRGNGFSIVYNRVAGTVTVRSEGKKLDAAAVYDASGASVVAAATADRVDDRTIVLDVSDIARGAYIVSTNLGGAKFLK